jgi:hypothetical protein
MTPLLRVLVEMPSSGELLDEKDVWPAPREGFGNGATDHATTDDQKIDMVHNPMEYD